MPAGDPERGPGPTAGTPGAVVPEELSPGRWAGSQRGARTLHRQPAQSLPSRGPGFRTLEGVGGGLGFLGSAPASPPRPLQIRVCTAASMTLLGSGPRAQHQGPELWEGPGSPRTGVQRACSEHSKAQRVPGRRWSNRLPWMCRPAHSGKGLGSPRWSGLEGFLEEAQQELKGREVKQARGWRDRLSWGL